VVLERILVRQAGVVTLAQARACGISADTVRRRVRAGDGANCTRASTWSAATG
jgi:hypothetical protein